MSDKADSSGETLTPDEKIKAFNDKVNSVYKGNIVKACADARAGALKRYSSGILALDCALGGGWPFNRISLITGEYSAGKTLLCLKAFEQIAQYDRATKVHKDFIKDPATFSPCRGLFVDAEGTFDRAWAITNGFNVDLHSIAQPEYAEQVIDLVKSAILEDVYDLIVVDSIAAMTPAKEIEASAEENQMGLQARLINKAFRTWVSSINHLAQDKCGPSIICINQFRQKIGLVFGDPRTMPGGKGQEFASSIIVYLKNAKISDVDDMGSAVAEFGGTIHKNKTYIPKLEYKYTMGLRDAKDLNSGEVDNMGELMIRGKKNRLITTDKKVKFSTLECNTQKELAAMLESSETWRRKLWRSIVKAETNATV